ncbi:MAG: protein-glutamate O-methyltransferase CheR [Flavobacteriales bacterium]|jgi:chemotaxis protein methyltransferase CheR|nr:protein-glutamate O-methyltransferase CheR [Flavobacteriales bacterium]
MAESKRIEIGEVEVEKIIDALNRFHGIDFSGYSRASFTRRIQRIADKDANGTFDSLLNRVSENKEYFSRFLKEVTVNVTEMFRDPSFFASLRKNVLPELNKQQTLQIWHAACSTGEEVYSMAVLLHEASLLERSTILGTDLNPEVLLKAKQGVFSERDFPEYIQNYERSGGKAALSEYYDSSYGNSVFKPFFKDKMTFSEHNLVNDGSFNKFNLIMCRNVLIYFQKPLQARVLHLFKNSLVTGGFLCLGSKESLLFSDDRLAFEVVDAKEKIYRKI